MRAASMAVTPVAPKLGRTLVLPGRYSRLQLVCDGIRRTPYGEPLRLRWPILLSIAITNECHSPCRNCYAALGRGEDVKHLSLASPVWTEVCQSGIPTIGITGGEPVNNPHLPELLASIAPLDKAVFVFTRDCTDRIIALAKRFGKRVTYVFSIYGGPDEHDRSRGRGNFAATLDTARQVVSHGGRFAINAVVGDSDDGGLASLAVRGTGLQPTKVMVTRLVSVGRGSHVARVSLSTDDIRRLAGAVRSALGCPVELHLPDLTGEQRRRSLSLGLRAAGLRYWSGCSVGKWAMHIDADGRYHECAFAESLPPVGADGIPLQEAWQLLQSRHARRADSCLVEAHRVVQQVQITRGLT